MRLQRKLFAFIVLIVVVTASTCFASYASGISGTENKKTDETELVQISPDTYIEELEQALPEDIRELLPQEEDSEDGVRNVDPSYLISISGRLLSLSLSGILRHFICFLSVIFLGAFAGVMEDSFSLDKRNSVTSLVCSAVIALEAFALLYTFIDEVTVYADRINSFILTFAGVSSSVILLGGGAGEAALSLSVSAGVSAFSSAVLTKYIVPIARICFACAIASSVTRNDRLTRISAFIRGTFTGLVGFIGTIFAITLTFQSSVVQAQDSLAARGVKMALGSIPVVGGAVSDGVRTLASSISLVKASTGAVGIAGILLITLFPLTSLFSARIALALSELSASVLNVSSCESVLTEVKKIIDLLIACVCILSVFCIFMMSIFIKSSAAISG